MADRIRQFFTVVLGIGALFTLGPALASPPQSRQPEPRALGQIQASGQHLDLRVPAPALDVAERPASFTAMAHRQSAVSQEHIPLPGSSDDMRSPRSVQDFVHRVHREGLPVARLFETKSALLHLGLSPKGKPGLWLVQKTR
jgi:hypothetical protein